MNPSPFRASPFSRRHALALAGGAALAVTGPVRRIAAQVTPIASPVAIPIIGLIALLFIVPIEAGAQSTPVSASPTTVTGDFAGLVDIGGRSLYLDCRGRGSPTVILESGAGNDARVWDTVSLPAGATSGAVLPGVAEFTRVCAYDRPGTFLGPGLPGRSDPVAMPRTAGDIVTDLHALLADADVPGPYVMAGHSFGGLVARLYASTYPDEVVGLILIDAAHEAYYMDIQQALTPAQWDSFARPAPSPDYPDLERIDTDASST
jgi:hypothetical protein